MDVEDCCNGAMYVTNSMKAADVDKLCIDGGSAGGFTTLACLTQRNLFKAGASKYGVSDLEALIRDTHKFESRYIDSMVGPYPECKELYVERSPINSAEKLNCPMIFFQGDEDKVLYCTNHMYSRIKIKHKLQNTLECNLFNTLHAISYFHNP